MSKELEALERIGMYYTTFEDDTFCINETQDYDTIETALKALEIIKEKDVDVGWFIISENHSIYNLVIDKGKTLKKKEYDLLKEVLL